MSYYLRFIPIHIFENDLIPYTENRYCINTIDNNVTQYSNNEKAIKNVIIDNS